MTCLLIFVNHDIGIVESSYAFTLFTCQTKLLLECQDLHRPSLKIIFHKIQHVLNYNGCAWFDLPGGATWFASLNGKLKTSNYKNRLEENSIVEKLRPLENVLVFGVVVINSIIYLLRIDNSKYEGKWQKTANRFKKLKLNCIFHFYTVPMHKRAYFVVPDKIFFYRFMK